MRKLVFRKGENSLFNFFFFFLFMSMLIYIIFVSQMPANVIKTHEKKMRGIFYGLRVLIMEPLGWEVIPFSHFLWWGDSHS